jgi:hypothetical protein
MKNHQVLLTAVLCLAVVSAGFVAPGLVRVSAQNQKSTALERGYRTGYSDGYQAGYKDIAEQAPSDYQSKQDYQRADRSYNEEWGPREDYRDGYQQGFEAGYLAGYSHQPFDSTLPPDFSRRSSADGSTGLNPAPTPDSSQSTASPPSRSDASLIPQNTVLLAELDSRLSTDATQVGDRFQARVIEPREYDGAIIEGHVSRVKRAGKVKGVAELQLSFDEIRMPDNRHGNLRAELIEVVDNYGNSGVGDVDREGGVKGKDSTKDDVSKVGAASGIGAVIGLIAGGGKGAAIGAIIGGAAGTGGVMTQRGKDIRLERGQQIRLRTSTDAQLQ